MVFQNLSCDEAKIYFLLSNGAVEQQPDGTFKLLDESLMGNPEVESLIERCNKKKLVIK